MQELWRDVDEKIYVEMCRVLAEPKRIRLLYLLANGETSVSKLVEQTGFHQPTISRHLQILRQVGLVNTERRGTYIFYSLQDNRVLHALDQLRTIFARQASDTD